MGAGDGVATFDAAAWAPARREYGLLHLLLCRQACLDAPTTPAGKHGGSAGADRGSGLKSLDTRLCSPAMRPAPHPQPPVPAPLYPEDSEEEDDDSKSYISEGDPHEPNETVSWGKGQRGAWWRVRASLKEDLVVRGGVSLASAELRRTSPGELLQQKGPPRVLTGPGSGQGCIRMPIQPCGWVTADASRAGGPQYLIRSHTPRWRAVYQSSTNAGAGGDVIVRAGPELDSEAVFSLSFHDIVEQAGPVQTRPDGIMRMPVTWSPHGRRHDDDDGPRAKITGWVTVDASAAGGPVFFKPAPLDNESPVKQQRGGRRQPGS